jgi:hypothetical protein
MINTLLSGLAGGSLVAFFAFLLRESIKAALTRSLTVQAELLKYELQREMLKAQLSTTQSHALYPRLLAKLHRANGVLAGHYGLRFSPSYEDHSQKDFERIVSELNLPGNERDRILGMLNTDRRSGVNELEKVMRREELQRARRLIIQARNFAILKSVFLSNPVKDLAIEITKTLWSAWVDIDVNSMPGVEGSDREKFFKSAQEGLKRATEQLEEIEKAMRDELHPVGAAGVSASG